MTGGAVRGGSIVVRISGDEAANGDDNELWRMFAILLVIWVPATVIEALAYAEKKGA
jgi:hypothetical protein